MRKEGITWDESWLQRDADDLYRLCGAAHEPPPSDGGPATFHHDSAPYLVATELPWLVLPEKSLEGRSVLTIAGSGDLPLFFRTAGARRVVAVDVSLNACFFSELKRSALGMLNWRESLAFFLSDLAGARGFLSARGIPPTLAADERWRLYERTRPGLSRSARAHWDGLLKDAGPGASPFRCFRGLPGLCFLEHIPYLASESAHEAWRKHSGPYPILNLPLQQAVGGAGISFDILYLSNVLDYWRQDHRARGGTRASFLSQLEHFLRRAWDLLSAGGRLFFYLFQSRAGRDFQSIRENLAVLRRLGAVEEALEVVYECPSIAGSRFHSTILGYLKA
jgi:hypothetical protein